MSSFCPRCGASMAANAASCEQCSYDFGLTARRINAAAGWLHSPLADFSLAAGALITGLGSVLALVGAVIAIFRGHMEAVISGPAAAVLCFALMVVFMRMLEGRDQDE
jgi:uncharacterized membrane protein YvbJ